MRDVMTSISVFLVLAVLLTGAYLAWHDIQNPDAGAFLPATDIQDVEDFINSLLGNPNAPGPTPVQPPLVLLTPRNQTPVLTATAQTLRPGGTSTATPTAAPPSPTPTLTPTVPPPPPTPAPLPTPTPVPTPTPLPPYPYVLDGSIRHDTACPGEYIIGVVRDARGNPIPGVTVRMEDEYGNGDTRVTKSNPGEVGRYEFVLAGPPRRIYVWVVDEGGNALSPRVEILHRLPNSGYETMTCHYVNWRHTGR